MQIYQKKIPISLPYQFSNDKSIIDNDILLFDIETTGFSPDTTSIYLIGCCYYQNNSWNLTQYFADDYVSEESILKSFIDLTKYFKVMIHYNGTGFDIPYLQKKFQFYKLDFSFECFLQIDLYKKISPYKRLLELPDLKQKTLETYLGLTRQDTYSGGELIDVYVSYMKNKFSHNATMQDNRNTLLLHNEEDVCNLVLLTGILAYSDLLEEPLQFSHAQVKEEYATLYFSLRNPVKTSFFYEAPENDISLSVQGCQGSMSIRTYYGTLKYFYSNYKDYYYLPKEDTAIHKSVATFVDKEYRQKAKASTCYTKKEGLFLPQFFGSLTPAFRFEYKDKTSYIELTPSFLESKDQCQDYLKSVINHLLKQNKGKGL